MDMTKREFFKRKNKNIIYSLYEDVVGFAYSSAQNYYDRLKELRDYKDKYRTNTHMWELLDNLSKDVTSTYIAESYTRCIMIKTDAYKVRFNEYNILHIHISRLQHATGKIESMLDLINYIEENGLGIRSV